MEITKEMLEDGYADIVYDQQKDAEAERYYEDEKLRESCGLIKTEGPDGEWDWIGTQAQWEDYENKSNQVEYDPIPF